MEQIISQDLNLIQWLVLAFIQGITEYLPVSSSAHLILVSKVMQWPDQGLIMDIAAHGGSLLAVLWYFKEEVQKLFKGENWTLFNKLALASIPLALAGGLLAGQIEDKLRAPNIISTVIALSSLLFGLLLYLSDRKQKKAQLENKVQKNEINLKQAITIGIAQILALIPGASRSGVTMTAAMAMGFNREKAARFSFLLAIPALLMTTSYGFLKVIQQPQDYNVLGVLVVFLVSFLASLISIKLFLKLIETIPMSFYLFYRVLLAVLVIWFVA